MGTAAHGHEMSAKETYMSHTANRHPFHVLPPSPWPLLAGWGAFVTCLGGRGAGADAAGAAAVSGAWPWPAA